MKYIYQILHKCILIILAVQLLNLSFNNLNGFYSRQNSSCFIVSNQINSGFEYVTEHLLGWDNYVPEDKSRTNHQTNHLHKTGNMFLYVCESAPGVININCTPALNYQVAVFSTMKGYKMEVNPPPPKVL